MTDTFRDPGEETVLDTFMVSLADALTCVFGAAIALFLIFLVLVKLDPAARASADAVEIASLASSQSIFAETAARGHSVTAILTTDSCTDLLGIAPASAQGGKLHRWVSPPHDGHAGQQCRLFLRFQDGLNAAVSLEARRPVSSLYIRLLAGSVYTEPRSFSISNWPGTAPKRFVTIQPDGDMIFDEER